MVRVLCELATIAPDAKRHLIFFVAGSHSCRVTRLCAPNEPLTLLPEDVTVVAQVGRSGGVPSWQFFGAPSSPPPLYASYLRSPPPQSIDLSAADRVIPVFHFERDTRFGHGAPFLFPLVRGEGISAMKARLAQSHLAGALSVKEVARMRLHLVKEGEKGVELVTEDALAQSAPSPLSGGPSPPLPLGLTLPSSPLLQGVNGAVAELGLSPATTPALPPADPSTSPKGGLAPSPGRPVPSPDSTRLQGPPTKLARSEPTATGQVSCLLPLPPAQSILPALPPFPWFPPAPAAELQAREAHATPTPALGANPVEEALLQFALGLEHKAK